MSDKRRSDDTTEPERSVHFGTPEQDPNPSVRFISAYMRPEPERSVYFASNFRSREVIFGTDSDSIIPSPCRILLKEASGRALVKMSAS